MIYKGYAGRYATAIEMFNDTAVERALLEEIATKVIPLDSAGGVIEIEFFGLDSETMINDLERTYYSSEAYSILITEPLSDKAQDFFTKMDLTNIESFEPGCYVWDMEKCCYSRV